MRQCREQGRLNWVFNVLDGLKEQEDIILRHDDTLNDDEGKEGFILSPDLNWDRTTLTSLHLLALVQRRDLWSLRDLRKKHIPWLRKMQDMILDATISVYGPGTAKGGIQGLNAIEKDELKLYVHYQPTYYHFHVHVVHIMCEAGGTQSVGKAIGFESIVSWLESMAGEGAGGGGEGEVGMDGVDLTYYVGERSEVWERVFGVLKEGGKPDF